MKDRLKLLAIACIMVYLINFVVMGENQKFMMMVMGPILGAVAIAFALFKTGKDHSPTVYKAEP